MDIYKKISKTFFKPSIDLFAFRKNHKVTRYGAFYPDPDAFKIESFSIYWKKEKVYAFPPFSIIDSFKRLNKNKVY